MDNGDEKLSSLDSYLSSDTLTPNVSLSTSLVKETCVQDLITLLYFTSRFSPNVRKCVVETRVHSSTIDHNRGLKFPSNDVEEKDLKH